MLNRIAALSVGLFLIAGGVALIPADPAQATSPETYGAKSSQEYRDSFLYGGTAWVSASARLNPEQEGDRGYEWAIAGADQWDYRWTWNFSFSYANASGSPYDDEWSIPPTEMYKAASEEMGEACLKNSWCNAYAHGDPYLAEDIINDSYFGFASVDGADGPCQRPSPTNPGNCASAGGFPTTTATVIYLRRKETGGIAWNSQGVGNGLYGPEAQFGSVSTVGGMRAFLKERLAHPEEIGTGYAYLFEKALLYLDLVYGPNNDSHPIEFLAIPREPMFVCLYQRPTYPQWPWIGNTTDSYYPPVYIPGTAGMLHGDNSEAAADFCPGSETGGYWEYAYESEIGLVTDESSSEIQGVIQHWVRILDDSPAGLGGTPLTTQIEATPTALGRKVMELCSAPIRPDGCGDAPLFTRDELAQLREAAQDETETKPRLDLTANNAQILANGRLAEVREGFTGVTIIQRAEEDRYMRRWISTRQRFNQWGEPVGEKIVEGDWEWAEMPERDRSARSSYFAVGTPISTRGYQVLVTHCNGQAFTDAVGEFSTDNRPVDDVRFEGRYLAATAVSDTYTDFSAKPWGRTGPTSELGFYDKVCSYEGVRTDPDTNAPVSEDDSLPASSHFRNGEPEELPVAYFTPAQGGWITYDRSGPAAVTATRWADGTPEVGQFFLGAVDRLTGRDTGNLFETAESGPAPVLKQWDLRDFDSPTVTTQVGAFSNLYTKGLWSTTRGKPQVVTVKWDFLAGIETMIPAVGIGFTRDGDATYHQRVQTARVRGQVTSSNRPQESHTSADREAYVAHTGTGSVNTLDVAVPDGVSLDAEGRWTTRPDLHSRRYWVVEYVRGTTS